MRLLPAVVVSLATIYQAVGVWAYLSPTSVVRVARQEDHHLLAPRAPPVRGSTTIPLYQESGHATWSGYRVLPGMAGASISNEVVWDTAYKTYQSVKDKLPSGGLVAVMYVPGGGWAAGTIWHGTDAGFQNFARRSPAFWNAVPVSEQGLLPDLGGLHQWHAEAVAAARAEQEFEDAMVDGLWPEGTKIYTYGQVWVNNGYVPGPKAACSDASSQIRVACTAWLGRLKIQVVPIQPDKKQ